MGHSYSKVIHGMLGAYNYELYPISPEELDPFINGRGYKGLNVTIPYKQQVHALCDGLDPMGEKIGAVNTLTSKGRNFGEPTRITRASSSWRRRPAFP